MSSLSSGSLASSSAGGGAAAADKAAKAAKAAAEVLAAADSGAKNAVLHSFADGLLQKQKDIVTANKKDIAAAKGLAAALKDRLLLDAARLRQMAEGVVAVAALPDPVGEMTDFCVRPSGIQVGKIRAPLGVILAIYESRPNVTADIAALALKSGNAVLLRGGREAARTNAAIAACLAAALAKNKMPPAAAQLIPAANRDWIDDFLRSSHIDLVVPRGGRGLIERVAQNARMPVLKHLDGNCHVYVDEAADIAMARKIIINAKTRRFGVCSAAESVLIHQKISRRIVAPLVADLQARDVEVRGCPKTRRLASGVVAANESDWGMEYLAPIVSMKIVADTDAAIAHINRHGSGHTDAVITDSVEVWGRFLRRVDSSSVMLNASTAFADGGEYGLGAEVGISTDKFHARGPVGLHGLTCQKYAVLGAPGGSVRS